MTTSGFGGRGKKSAWEAWKAYPDVTETFMPNSPHLLITSECQHFQLLEQFSAVLYDKTSDLKFFNEARRELFCQKNKTMKNIPPTQDALLQHCKHVSYQTRIWTTSDIALQQSPLPKDMDGHWIWKAMHGFLWITLPLASQSCTELVKCGCKSKNGCGARCSCKKARWKCTELCTCRSSK